MSTTTIHPTNPIKTLASKAAEIYREDGGRICYLCFHCGFDSDNITAILTHIEIHFTSSNHIETDGHSQFADIKTEPFDEDLHTDSNQLEQVFVDCDIKPISDQEHREEMVDNYINTATPEHGTLFGSDDNSTHLECLFEWKCLHCQCLFKRTKLMQHLRQKHKSDLVMNDTKVHYTLKCTLCSSEFYDLNSSEEHLKDSHPASPPVKCFLCNEKFQTCESLKYHTCVVDGSTDGDDTVAIESIESAECKKSPDQKTNMQSMCIFCDKTISGRLEFIQHTFGHFSLKVFSCPECPTNFQRMNTLNTHMKKVHNKRLAPNLSCRFCKANHENLFELLSHSITDHLDDGERNNWIMDTSFDYQCRFCFKEFDKWIDVTTHLKDHARDELPNEWPSAVIDNGRTFTERARSKAYRSEVLYNCLSCTSTLCGSYEARKHEIIEHKLNAKSVQQVQAPQLSNPLHYRVVFQPEMPVRSEKKNLQCFDCDKTFETKIYLMRHRLTHFDIQPYSCMVCAQTFCSRAAAGRHITKEHSKGTEIEYSRALTCRFCKLQLSDDNSFIEHSFNEHLYENFNIDENLDELCKYQCAYCNEIITGRHCMDQHLQNHADETLPELKSEDKAPEELSINELRHKAEFRYLCLQCTITFRLPFVARTHAKSVHRTEEIVTNTIEDDGTKTTSVTTKRGTHCSTCNTSFMTWRSMINHRAKVHPETIVRKPNYKKQVVPPASGKKRKKKRRAPEGNHCNICDMAFLNNRSMINHRTKRHPETVETTENRQLFTCPICGKSAKERSNFNKHMETHTKVRSYSCNMCHKSYRLKNSLDTHLLTHNNEKNFVCEECGKSFYTTSKLNLHKQVHENLTLQCDKCEKVFYTRNNFSKHQKTHIDAARKKCKVCGNTFKSAVSLRVHMALHDVQKKFSCRYCNMSFAQSSGRRGHERSRHGIV